MTWTIEALNREHPLPEGWAWRFQYVNEDTDALDTTRPFARGRNGVYEARVEVIDGKLFAVDATSRSFDPPVDAALAVLLANRAGGPATDEPVPSAKLRSSIAYDEVCALFAAACERKGESHEVDQDIVALERTCGLLWSVYVSTGRATGSVHRYYRDLLDASKAARDWVREHGDEVLPCEVRVLVETAWPGRISDMIDLLARDERRVLEWRRAELRKAVDAGGSDAEATELAEDSPSRSPEQEP